MDQDCVEMECRCDEGEQWRHKTVGLQHNLLCLNLWKAEIKLTLVWRPSPYRAVNTPHLSYKNQSVNAV